MWCKNPEYEPDVFATKRQHCTTWLSLLKDRHAYEYLLYCSKLTTSEDLSSSSVFIIT